MLDDRLQIWLFRLDDFWPLQDTVAGKSLMVLEEELEASKKFLSTKRQREFLVSRGLLRKLCAQIENKPQEEINFYNSESGALYRSINQKNYSFSISHNENNLLICFSHSQCLGCDIQQEKPFKNREKFVKKIAHENEIKDLAIESASHSEIFRLWVLKESAYKALSGKKGIAFSQIDCSDKEYVWVLQDDYQKKLYYHYRRVGNSHMAIVTDKLQKMHLVGVNK